MEATHQSTPGPAPVDAGAIRVWILGTNTWLVVVVVPLLVAGPGSLAGPLLAAVPIATLGLGAILLDRHRNATLALWLVAFPTAVATLAAAMSALVVGDPPSTVGIVLGALSMLAYVLAAAERAGRPPALRPSRKRPLGSAAPVREDAHRRRARHTLILGSTAAALALAVVVPAFGLLDTYRRAWGPAAAEAAVLTTVVGGALGSSALALFVGPALRASREPPPTARMRRRRVTLLLSSVGLGLLFYVFYVTHGPR